jgi:hypothetical protein
MDSGPLFLYCLKIAGLSLSFSIATHSVCGALKIDSDSQGWLGHGTPRNPHRHTQPLSGALELTLYLTLCVSAHSLKTTTLLERREWG